MSARAGSKRASHVHLVACWLVGAALAGCVGPSPLPPTTVSLRMTGAPADAVVSIDDQTLGPLDYVAEHGVALPPGVHHVTVQSAGYFPWDKEVTATITDPPTLIRLDARLVPIPD